MHWLTKPGTSHPEMVRITTRGQRGAARDPGRAQLRRAHRPGAARRRGRRHRTSARTGSASIPSVDYDETLADDPGGGRRLSRALPRRADLPQGADPGGPDRRPARRSSSASTATTSTMLRAKADEVKEIARGVDGVVDAARRAPGRRSRRSRSRSTSTAAQRYGLKPGDVRRAAGHPDRRRGGRRHLPRRQGLRRQRLEHARDPRTASTTSRTC